MARKKKLDRRTLRTRHSLTHAMVELVTEKRFDDITVQNLIDRADNPGALQSPQILQLSGVGPAGLLHGLGIPVVADSPEVGRNLQDHYQARLIVRLKQPISLNDQVRKPLELAKMGLQWMFAGSGPLTVGAGQVGGAACTLPASVASISCSCPGSAPLKVIFTPSAGELTRVTSLIV